MENELLQKVKDDFAASQISNGVEFNNWAEFMVFHSGEPMSWFETHVNAIAEAYATKQSQKDQRGELMKMDEGKAGEQCFTEDSFLQASLLYTRGDGIDAVLHLLNTKASQYATNRAKKVLDVIDIKMNNAYASRDFYVRTGDREAINKYTYRIELLEELKEKLTDPKNLEI